MPPHSPIASPRPPPPTRRNRRPPKPPPAETAATAAAEWLKARLQRGNYLAAECIATERPQAAVIGGVLHHFAQFTKRHFQAEA